LDFGFNKHLAFALGSKFFPVGETIPATSHTEKKSGQAHCHKRRLLLPYSTMQFIDRKFTSVIKRWHLGWLTGSAFLLFSASSLPADANVTIIREDFSDSTAYGWTVGGVGPLCLTAEGPSPPESIPNCSTNSDPPREGTLRLTNLRISDQRAFVFYDYAIPANQGLVITFDYFAYGGRTVEQSGADGTTFFLFDGNTPTPDPGAEGGALGYAQLVSCSTPKLRKMAIR
jgi:hypothetical protein